MFPLLSRLPQLSLKRGSRSTCLLIHLKHSNNRTPLHLRPPHHIYLSISPFSLLSPASLPPITFPYQTSIPSSAPQYSLFLPPPLLASSLASPLGSNVGSAESTPPTLLPPSPLPASRLPLFLLPRSLLRASLQGTGRGKTKRLNILDCTQPEEKQRFDVPCDVSDSVVLFVCAAVVFFHLHRAQIRHIDELL